jgi:hypothetical protein
VLLLVDFGNQEIPYLHYCLAGLVEKSVEGKLVKQQSFIHPDCTTLCMHSAHVKYGILIKRCRNKKIKKLFLPK